MINNRQNGRRRGRGGGAPRPNGGGGNQDRGNRIDNRARGNANQLHEKYKTLARDAQTQGDRVMTEYYLQFADHYFRVLSESRSRFEEQQQQRRDRYETQEFEGDEGETGGEDRYEGRPQQGYRPQRGDERPVRDENSRDDNAYNGQREFAEDRENAREDRDDYREDRPQRRPSAVREDVRGDRDADDRFEFDGLPPSMLAPIPTEANDVADDAEEAAVEKPRARRGRKPRGDVPAAAE